MAVIVSANRPHRPHRRPARDRDPQSRQARRDARPAGALRHRRHIGGRARPARAGRNRHDAFATTRASRRRPPRKASGLPAFADDSGLAVDALGGEPGIYSARWAGPDKDFRRAMNKIADAADRARREDAGAARARISSPRCASPGRTATSKSSRRASTARWSGRRAATRASATIRCSCPTATTAPSAR